MIGLELLQKKCGSSSTLREFRRLLSAIIEDDAQHHHMPDYGIRWRDDDSVIFERRDVARLGDSPSRARVHLRPETMEKARTLARGWDVYVIESDWRVWMADSGMDPPKNPDSAFLGFVKKWAEKRGPAQS